MAIALDAFVDITTTTGTSLTYSHTVAGSNRLIVVDSIVAGATVTGVTYNGTSLTGITQITDDASRIHKLWYLKAPDTGANNVVISVDASVFIRGTSASYTGVDQTTPVGNSGTATSSTSPVGPSLVTTVTDSWGVASFRSDTGTQGNGTCTLRAVANSLGYMDTNGGLGAPATESIDFTISSGTGYVVAAIIQPAAAAGGAKPNKPNLLTLGVG